MWMLKRDVLDVYEVDLVDVSDDQQKAVRDGIDKILDSTWDYFYSEMSQVVRGFLQDGEFMENVLDEDQREKLSEHADDFIQEMLKQLHNTAFDSSSDKPVG